MGIKGEVKREGEKGGEGKGEQKDTVVTFSLILFGVSFIKPMTILLMANCSVVSFS